MVVGPNPEWGQPQPQVYFGGGGLTLSPPTDQSPMIQQIAGNSISAPPGTFGNAQIVPQQLQQFDYGGLGNLPSSTTSPVIPTPVTQNTPQQTQSIQENVPNPYGGSWPVSLSQIDGNPFANAAKGLYG